MEREEILAKIREAEMVLVGLGEDFDDGCRLRECKEYIRGRELLREYGCLWLQPAWNEYCSERLEEKNVSSALQKLAGLLEDKNYFIVSTSTNSRITEIPWKEKRVVMPCGSVQRKQCGKGCGHGIEELSSEDRELLKETFDKLYSGVFPIDGVPYLGKCPECGAALVLNNIYAENYNELGYMEQWRVYTKWLRGTLNRKLVVLELGVSMRFPTVIRWPFEKAAFFNNKATFVRVNEKLYQLTEELKEKGYGIPQNAIDWLRILC